jgi:Zn-dependent protease
LPALRRRHSLKLTGWRRTLVRQDVPLGRVAGITVAANWTVAVILALITWLLGGSVLPGAVAHQPMAAYWVLACATAVLFLASLLGHEFSHALVARRNGLTVRAITLWMLGGITELEGEPPDAAADLRIAVAGPAVSAAAAGVFLGAAMAVRYAGGPAVVAAALVWLALMNGMIAVFNMLPGAPLDGGRVLRAVLWRHYRDRRRGEVAAARAGQFLGAGIIGIGAAELLWDVPGGLWLMLIGWFLVSAADVEKRAATAKSALADVRVADVMTADPQVAQGWITVQDFVGRIASWSRQDAFPVVDWSGSLVGVVVTELLAKVSPGDRAGLRLDQVALAVPPPYLAAPEDPAGPLLTRRPLGGEVMAVVLAGGQVVGIVTVGDLRQAVRRHRLAA